MNSAWSKAELIGTKHKFERIEAMAEEAGLRVPES